MPHDSERGRLPGGIAALEVSHGGEDDSIVDHAADIPLPRRPDPARDLRAWGAAVEHLHRRGLPAAVPPLAAAWLRRRGTRPDWEAAA